MRKKPARSRSSTTLILNERHVRPTKHTGLTRREFMRLLGLNLAALGLPPFLRTSGRTRGFQLPAAVQEVLDLLPELSFDASGRLVVQRGNAAERSEYAPLVPTLWNEEHSRSIDRLEAGQRWAIVLHWFGDTGEDDQAMDAYLRGFNALRPVFTYETRTSAHFLVGNTHPGEIAADSPQIGIVQTQVPDEDGHPFLASHLQALDYTAHWDKRQYFVRAYYQLARTEPGSDSVLQDFYDSPIVVDPNLRSIAIEITGFGFDEPGRLPAPQKIANTVALVWALMKKYNIRATDILGHHEIQLGKSDPGKKFVALVRYFIGIVALFDPDPTAFGRAFGDFGLEAGDLLGAAERYFQFVRSYLVLVGTPEEVYRWEADTRFWLTCAAIFPGRSSELAAASTLASPLRSPFAGSSQTYLEPHNHEGVDLLTTTESIPISLIAPGLCLYAGEATNSHWQRFALFRHRQPDGAEVVAAYGHLANLDTLQPGRIYPQRHLIGRIERPNSYQEAYLHFAVAYGATWDSDLSREPTPPLNAGTSWIRRRYIDPLQYLDKQSSKTLNTRKGYPYD